MRIAVLDDYQDATPRLEAWRLLAGHEVTVFHDTLKDEDALVERLAGFEALVLIRERTRFPASLLERLPRLRALSQTAKAGAHIDIAACTRLGIAVLEGGGTPHATAELTWGLVLAAMRRIPQEVENLKRGGWQQSVGLGLRGRTLGVYGFGKIGAVVAGYGRAFGMHVQVFGREGSRARAEAEGYPYVASRQRFFASSDVLALHVRLAPETRGLVMRADLEQMKPSAVFVNTSRAELLEPGALAAALAGGRPGMAAVDVYEDEPVRGAGHPLIGLPNAICTPHLGYVERDGYEHYFGTAFGNLAAFAAGAPRNVANPDYARAARR